MRIPHGCSYVEGIRIVTSGLPAVQGGYHAGVRIYAARTASCPESQLSDTPRLQMTKLQRVVLPVLATLCLPAPAALLAQDQDELFRRAAESEIWEPEPPVVTPGPAVGMTHPPSDAIVLFDGTGLNQWVNSRDGEPAGWRVEDGVFTVVNEVGDIETARSFQDFQLHLEWRVSANVQGSGQSRGNSGVFLTSIDGGGYEVQILDAYENPTYVNGMAGSVYKQSIPLANPARPPGEWQVYDIVWRAPRFNDSGEVTRRAQVTVVFNGVVVQDAFELEGKTLWVGEPYYEAHGPLPIRLQAHGDPGPGVSFRNIWLRELP